MIGCTVDFKVRRQQELMLGVERFTSGEFWQYQQPGVLYVRYKIKAISKYFLNDLVRGTTLRLRNWVVAALRHEYGVVRRIETTIDGVFECKHGVHCLRLSLLNICSSCK